MLSRLHTHIVVTDSRVDRAGYDAPTPTTVVGQAELQKRNPARLIDLIAEMPHFFNDSNTSSQGSGSTGTGGQSFVNLRALGATRTLVLLDRHRIVPTTATGDRGYFADPRIVDHACKYRPGGASAAYGSPTVRCGRNPTAPSLVRQELPSSQAAAIASIAPPAWRRARARKAEGAMPKRR